MNALLSPPPLQQICHVATATWLTDWSALVGQISSRASAAAPKSLRLCKHPERPVILRNNFNKDQPATKQQSCICVTRGCQENLQSKREGSYRDVSSKPNDGHCHKKLKKFDRPTPVHYELKDPEGDDVLNDGLILEYLGQNDSGSTKTPYGMKKSEENSCQRTSLPNFQMTFNTTIIENCVKNCSYYIRRFLPPVQVNHIMNLAWKQISRLISVGSSGGNSQEYHIGDWLRRAPILLRLSSELSCKCYPLHISGVPDHIIENVIQTIYEYFPLKSISSLVFPRTDFKRSRPKFSNVCKTTLIEILSKASLSFVTLNSDMCDDRALTTLSGLRLKGLEIGGSFVTEKGIINGLCGLPVESASEAIEIIKHGILENISVIPLRTSLQTLDMSFQNLPESVYAIILVIFPQLLYYTPHRNVAQCIQAFASMNSTKDSSHILKLLRVNAGHSSRNALFSISRTCPLLQELALALDLNELEALNALQNFPYLNGIELTYYPSSPSSVPKLNAQILQPILDKFGPQLKSLSLRGFNILGNTMHELSKLPELCHLNLEDCWLSNPRILPPNPFQSLTKLKLNFLPANSTMQFLTVGGALKNLNLDLKESEWGGNSLTDANIKQFVTSGVLRSIQTFEVKSSYLTLDSLKLLKSLPFLETVGFLASWGLTTEELRCVNHSGPQHVLCFH